jgi:hypothetical protein
VGDTDVDEENARAQDNTQVWPPSIVPMILTGLNEALATGPMHPVSNRVNASVVTPDSLRATLVGKDVPRLQGEIGAT